jgi:F-type H+/Na+-transporting ATPase subunit alpha
MTGLLESLDRWLPHARAQIAAHEVAPRLEQIGRIERVGDGIAMVSGLPDVRLDELLVFGARTPGFAFSLEQEAIGCILLGEAGTLAAGDPVHGTGTVLTVPVGDDLLGRVVDPLGGALDGGPAIEPERFDQVERPAPEIVDRELVTQPLATGVLVIDALFPLGRGQRELIVGDRATGKTPPARVPAPRLFRVGCRSGR